MKYLKKFLTQNEYGEFVESDKFIKPHVSYITENKKVNFHKKIRKPVEPEGNTVLTAKYYASEETNFAALFNDCGIKSLKIDGVPVEREFPKPITQTIEVKAEDVVFTTDAEGATGVEVGDKYNLYNDLSAIAGSKDDYGVFLHELYLRPKYGTIESNNINAVVLALKEGKGTALTLRQSNIYQITYDSQSDVFSVDMSLSFQNMPMYALLQPKCFVLANVDDNGDINMIDTIEEVTTYLGTNVYDEATSSTTPSIMFSESGEHTLEIELLSNSIPPVMFSQTCITGITCNTNLNFIGASSFSVTPLMEANFHDIGKVYSNAFFGCALFNANILSKTHTIGSMVFSYCLETKNIVLPEELVNVGLCSYEGCTSVESITFKSKTAPLLIVEESDGSSITNFFFMQEVPTNPVTVYIPQDADLDSYELWLYIFNNAKWPVVYY